MPNAGLAINETGMGFISDYEGIVDVRFKDVRAIRFFNPEAAV